MVTTSMRSLMMSFCMPMKRSPSVINPSAQRLLGLLFDDGILSAANCSIMKTLCGLSSLKTADDVIPIGPGKGIICILTIAFYLALRVTITRDVKPVPSPTFAIMGRREESIDDLGEYIRPDPSCTKSATSCAVAAAIRSNRTWRGESRCVYPLADLVSDLFHPVSRG